VRSAIECYADHPRREQLGHKYVEIVLTGSVRSIQPNGALKELVEATRTEIALGERVLKRLPVNMEGNWSGNAEGRPEEIVVAAETGAALSGG